MPEIRRLLNEMGVEFTILSDPSEVWNTPTDGEFRMYDGGTTKAEIENAINAKATIIFQEYCGAKTGDYIAGKGQEVVYMNHPMGVGGTDKFLMEVSRITGKPIPASLEKERGQLIDAIADSQAYLHGKRYAIFGDPDLTLGVAAFLLELGAEPAHVVCTNSVEDWEQKMQAVFDASPFGTGCKAYPKRDLWHMRSLLFTEPVDFLIGSSHGKYLERDCKVPLIRLGFPIMDRHHHHRFPVWGYAGGLRVLVSLLDKYFDVTDAANTDTTSFDLVR